MDILAEAKKLLWTLELGSMPGVVYDTAWLARVPKRAGSKEPRFPSSVKWLIRNQNWDGSWGSIIGYPHDKMVSTLAAVLAFASLPEIHRYKKQIVEGCNYIWKNLYDLKTEPYETAGFELIFPALMEEARTMGVGLPYDIDICKRYDEICKEKRKPIPKKLIYSKETTVAFSAECLGESADFEKLKELQGEDGSLFCSPSATAFLLRGLVNNEIKGKHRDLAEKYLENALKVNSDGSVPFLYPFDGFEKGWCMNHFFIAGMPLAREYKKFSEELWQKDGARLGHTFPLADADDTSVVFKILASLGKRPDPSVLEKFFHSKGYFTTYPFERRASVAVNAHALEALKSCEDMGDKIVDVLRFLEESKVDAYWTDKYHLSPLYATMHTIVACLYTTEHYPEVSDIEEEMARGAINWLLKRQHSDGSWGIVGGNIEETAYALLALTTYSNKIKKIERKHIQNGFDYLSQNFRKGYFELYVGKGLYAPTNVIKSAILAAMYACKKSLK